MAHLSHFAWNSTELDGWLETWVQKITDPTYQGYKDGASKVTLANREAGSPSGKVDTTDLAGVSRFFPLLALGDQLSQEELINLSQEQAICTHANPALADVNRFFVAWIYKCHESPSTPPSEILKTLQPPSLFQEKIDKVHQFLQDPNPKDSDVIDSFGKFFETNGNKLATARGCGMDGAVPATVYLVCKYQDKGLFEAIKANVLIGGDSAARGMLITSLLSPYSGTKGFKLPEGWFKEFKHKTQVEDLIRLLA
jgi:ADP-ribosylglycohydrolase